jgi:hypothetical protein
MQAIDELEGLAAEQEAIWRFYNRGEEHGRSTR